MRAAVCGGHDAPDGGWSPPPRWRPRSRPTRARAAARKLSDPSRGARRRVCFRGAPPVGIIRAERLGDLPAGHKDLVTAALDGEGSACAEVRHTRIGPGLRVE